MLEYDWENSVGFFICATSHALRKALGQELSQEGITLRQFEVLACISCKGCQSQQEVAGCLGIEAHTLAGVLNRMERDGLLIRRSSPQDRRRNTIHPTDRAEELWQRASGIAHEVRTQALAGIPPEQLAMFREVCRSIHENLQSDLLPRPVQA